MIKRYYRSLITLKFAAVQTIAAFLVFIFAFMTFRTGNRAVYWLAVACGIVLIAIMVYTQIAKAKMSSQLKPVEHLNQYYDEGAVLGRSFFLEDRMLLCTDQMKIRERKTDDCTSMKVVPAKKEKYDVTLDDMTISVDNHLQAKRLAAFLKRKNPAVKIDGVKPDGSGTLKELGAEK
jgi:cell division protein FtsW (lipid II flippase)